MERNASGDVGGQQSEPRSHTKRKRTPSSEEPHSVDHPSPADAAGQGHQEDGLLSVGLSDTSVFDCPLCYEALSLPVFQCTNGHVLCSDCRESVKQKCPSCSKKISIRCRAIEFVLESVKVPCSYNTYGCPKEISYSLKRAHETACAYAPYACPFTDCNFLGCQKRLSLHLNTAHGNSVIRLRFDDVCQFSMSRAEKFVVFREEAHGTLFILNKYDRMAISCIDGSNVSVGDRFAYAVVVRGKESCLRFQSLTSRFETTPSGKCVTIGGPTKDFVQVPGYLFDYDGCLRLEVCVWKMGVPAVDIASGGIGEANRSAFN